MGREGKSTFKSEFKKAIEGESRTLI